MMFLCNLLKGNSVALQKTPTLRRNKYTNVSYEISSD